ncbi:glycoside hydrolase family 5 protein [Pelagicoccus sp. SDUM812005]|uniref:glycoside hydrolase family 5 protein n=1 Tax=Pelagicoccus sp. SDUM812005 TaxID=3041257 RepID=UPI00280E6AFA|nr:glycoside hydrolase family 5 protein [Pelagicoccus sp. SDUM812005]MDQ8181344.1 glycoside hydrolase family 5 protein [Pelagicoccus sp. SDUM812005]
MKLATNLLTLLAILAMSSACQRTETTPPPSVPQLRVEGTQLVNEAGEAVVLRGVSYGWHNWWPRFYNKDSVKWLKEDWGVDVVRAAMGIHYEEPELTYNEEPKKAVEIISKVIDGAIESGVYVIIDFHSHHLESDLAKTFFADMATRYGKYPNIIYEIYNEPVDDSWEEVKAYSEEVIATIRAIDPDNIILVGNPHWDQDLHIVADNQIEGVSNIMYTLHYYAATHGDYLRERGDYALSKGAPIFISESAGMEASGDGPMDYEAWQTWQDWAEERKISWITWSISDKDETCSFLYPSASSKGGWSEKDLKESAQATRTILRKKAGLD